MFDIQTEEKLFKDFVTPGVIAEIKSKSKIWDQIQKSDKLTLGGFAAKQKVLIRASQASRASNSDKYPEPQESTPAETLVYLKRSQMFSIKFSGFAQEAAAKGGAAMEPVEFEKTGIFITMRDDMSRQLLMDGSGRLCQANGSGSGTKTLIVDSPWYAKATKFLKKGRVIDSYDGTTQEIDSNEIDTKDSDVQVTLKNNATWSNDSWIMNEDTYGGAAEAPGTGEMMGLLGIASNQDPPKGALQGLDVATYPEWKAYVDSHGGVKRPFSEDLLIAALDEAEEWGEVSFALYTKKLRRVYRAYLAAHKEFGQSNKLMWGGWVGMPFYYEGREIPLVVDAFVPDGMIIGGDQKKLKIYVTKLFDEVTWEKQRDGSILQKVPGYNQFRAEGHIFANMGVGVRQSFFRIEDIEEPAK